MRKTFDVWALQKRHGSAWETIETEREWDEIQRIATLYRENERGLFRFKKIRMRTTIEKHSMGASL